MGFFKNLFSKKSKPVNSEIAPKEEPEEAFEKLVEVEPKNNIVHIVIDDDVINDARDMDDVIRPLGLLVNTSNSQKEYEDTLKPFSLPQRYVFAINTYAMEVNNGGHDQFFFNSSGIVWEDALKGFATMGAHKNADILKQAAERMGGRPSKDQEERQDALEENDADFDDLDDLYYAYESEMGASVYKYILANAKDFHFSGDVKKP